jgi:hypothetical protein
LEGRRYTAPIVEPATGDSVACTSQNDGVPVAALAGTVLAEAIDVPGIDTAESAVHASCAETALEAARTILDV